MIVDCYTHTWESADQLGRCIPSNGNLAPFPGPLADPLQAAPARHLAAAEPVNTTIVLGFKTHYLEAEISNEQVASYVSSHPDRLIGFAGVDPSRPKEAVAELHSARDGLSMRGVAVAPAAQDFHPSNSQAMLVYAEASELGMSVLFHTGVYITAATKMEYAQPVLLDEVARELPDLKIIIAHMGFPWVNETTVLLAKHRNVFAEISWLLAQPWQAYHALISAYQFGVMDKLLFGSGFPFTSASNCIEALYSINHLCHGTNLPTIPREHLRGIVQRDALPLLGIASSGEQPAPQPTPDVPDDEHEE
jgi:predicted TIM-barrel fold metal-dependent hydrolase